MASRVAGYRVYAWAVGVGGVTAAVLSCREVRDVDWTAALVFVTMASVAEFLDVRLPTGIRLSMSFAPLLPSFLLLGAAETTWVNVVSSLLGNALPRRRPVTVAIFNVGQYALSCLAAGWAYRAADGHMGLPVLLLVITYFLVNHFLVSLFAAWREVGHLGGTPRKVLELIRGSLPWEGLNYLVTIPVGISMAVTYRVQGPAWSVLVFIPVLAVAYILRLHLELQATYHRLTVIQEVGQRLNTSLERGRVLDMLQEAVCRLVRCDVCAIYLRGSEDDVLELARLRHPCPDAFSLPFLRLSQGVLGRLIAAHRAALTKDALAAGWVRASPDDPVPPLGAAVIPLVMDETLLGVLWVSSTERGGCSPREFQVLQVLGNQAAVALQNAALYRKAEELSVIDDLTGLYNHRYFTRQLQYVTAHCASHGDTAALVYVDMDDMGDYNNTYGHVVGDELLREFAQVLRSAVREEDVPTRYGGDEFAVILAGASRAEALAVAERIRARVESFPFHGPDSPLRMTTSIGVAVFPEDTEDVTDLVRIADRAMYDAKSAGGNRVRSPKWPR